ncbi:MAG: hypothetical protein ACRYF5_16915, partial [Janthinobacterium lividum]
MPLNLQTMQTMQVLPLPADTQRRAAAVRLMIFDVDGVLTDGSLQFGTDGEMLKTFHVIDG